MVFHNEFFALRDSLFKILKSSYMKSFSEMPHSHLPFFPLCVPANSFVSALAVFLGGSVAHILTVSRHSQIISDIQKAITIPVLNLHPYRVTQKLAVRNRL